MLDITPERDERFRQVAQWRQADLTIILENVHDPHNVGAVLRSADAVGISEVYLIHTDPRIIEREKNSGKSTSTGVLRWLKIKVHYDLEECIDVVRKKYETIYGTLLNVESQSLYDLDMTRSVALMFGNEHKGLSTEALKHIDGNFIIPQYGFAQSLNISVACAVSLFEASRQRKISGYYDHVRNQEHVELTYQQFIEINDRLKLNKRQKRINWDK